MRILWDCQLPKASIRNSARVRQRHAAYQLILAAIENPDLLTPERTEKLTKLLGEPSLWAGHAGLPSRARGFKELLEQDDPDKTKLKLRGENLAKMMASANRDVFKDLDRSLDEGRARSQIRAKGRLWQEDRFDRLIAMASGQGHGNGHNQQVNGQVQINGQAQANGHDEHGAHGHDHEAGPVGKVLGATETKYAFKAANNGLLLGDAIAHQREHLFHEELHFDLKVDAAALGLKGVEHILGLGQAVMLAKDASHHLHVTGKVRDDYRTAARTFKQADSNWKEVSLAVKTIDKGLKHMVPPEELIGGFAAALNKGQHAPATFKPRDAAVFKRVVLALSPDLSERGKQHLETYLTNADANLRENAYAQLMREVSNGLNDGSQLGFAPFENAKERLLRDLSTEKRAADAANKTMSKMVATYGKNQEVADAMRSEYKAELGIATANLIKYVAELGEDALHALHFFHDLPMKEATKAALEVAGGALGLVAGAIGAGVATYETIHEAHGAHEDKKTAQKASDVKNVFMKQTEQLSAVKANGQYETNDSVLAPRDPELAGIYETVSKHHTDLSGKKTKKAIGEATLAAGYIAGGIASGASLATGATAVGIAAAAGPVGWALLGVGAVGVIGLTAYNYAQKYIAAKENEALRKVMTGDWEALQAYAQRHDDLPELNNEQDLAARKVVQNHALAAMTKQSVRFALAQFHERLKHEVENVDSAHWGHAPTIKALSAFYKDPVQIKAIAQLGTGQAMEILAKRFQIDLPGGQAPVY
ncbi:hypothetical protein E1178_03350 [Roseibium hamelinense]|uniref:hypothetical protein n=1 Tax=Roseibium hamelinense TaxID=150831 RepID=UPI0012BB7A7A|nr:hypothetical protein [Roseibium hamelinense]MTI42634.1 hypothetical protein [Roseibium hamelinense]